MINDQNLILFHYGDGLDAAEQQRIAAALGTDPELAERLRVLREQLALLDAPTVSVAPPEAVQQRWRTALAREARLSQPESLAHRDRWAWLRGPRMANVAAAVVLMTFGIGVGQWLDNRPDRHAQQPVGSSSNTSASVQGTRSPLLRGVQLHLQDTEQLLPQLASTSSPEQRRSLLAETRSQNRMYAIAAEAHNDVQLARVLRAVDAALESLARERSDPLALAADQAQLRFELAVMQTKLARAASKDMQNL